MNSLLNFFSTNSVKKKITEKSLSEAQLFIYFYLILMFDTISFVYQWFSIAGMQPTLLDWVNIYGYLLINSLGLIFLFLANGGIQGQDFIKKYFSFSFTVGYKYFVLSLICSVLLVSQIQHIIAFVGLNILMISNIALRLYQSR